MAVQEALRKMEITEGSRVVAAYAHPDDEQENEALLSGIVASGAVLHLAYASEGNESTEGDQQLVQSGHRFQVEAAAVAKDLGVPKARLHSFGLGDGKLHHHGQASALRRELTKLLVRADATHLIVPGLDYYETRPHRDHKEVRKAGLVIGQVFAGQRKQLQVWGNARPGEEGVVVPVDASRKLQRLKHHKTQMMLEPDEKGSVEFFGWRVAPGTARRLEQYRRLFEREVYARYIGAPTLRETRATMQVLEAMR